MRIYGSSPLYNYVELIFRCKRMFIVSIILGTVITSLIVAQRATSYDAAILVALTGDPAMAVASNQRPNNEREITPAQRKAGRLDIWIQRRPQFLEEVAENALLDKKYPGKTLSEIARDIRKKIVGPVLLNEQYMELKLTWHDPEEAEAILNNLFSKFSEQTVAAETFLVTEKRSFLEKQYKSADEKADRLAKLRITLQKDNYWKQPTMLAFHMGENEQIQRKLGDTRLDLADAETRLQDVMRQLQGMEPMIPDGQETVMERVEPTMKLAADLQELEKQKKQLLQSYSPLHPKVQDLDKQILATQQQIADIKNQPAAAPQKTIETNKLVRNPIWAELRMMQAQLEQTIRAQRRRMADLNGSLSTIQSRLTVMPDWEAKFNEVEQNYQLADTIRRNLHASLAAAELDEERDKSTQALTLNLEVPPKAEKTDSSGKKVLLYFLGPLLGIFVAFCFSLFAESLDHTLRTPVEVERYLGKPVLAVIPRMAVPREGRKKLAGASSKPSITS
jgi:uncharacterized protein involved in exopolysaccharide biosynthesis